MVIIKWVLLLCVLYVRAADRLERVEAKTVRRLNHNISVPRPRGVLLHQHTCTGPQHSHLRTPPFWVRTCRGCWGARERQRESVATARRQEEAILLLRSCVAIRRVVDSAPMRTVPPLSCRWCACLCSTHTNTLTWNPYTVCWCATKKLQFLAKKHLRSTRDYYKPGFKECAATIFAFPPSPRRRPQVSGATFHFIPRVISEETNQEWIVRGQTGSH